MTLKKHHHKEKRHILPTSTQRQESLAPGDAGKSNIHWRKEIRPKRGSGKKYATSTAFSISKPSSIFEEKNNYEKNFM